MTAYRFCRHLSICLVGLGLLASACSSTADDEPSDSNGSGASGSQTTEITSVTGDATSATEDASATENVDAADDKDLSIDSAEVAPDPDPDADADATAITTAGDNPAEEEIRNFFNSQAPSYGWDDNQAVCVADAVVATGATNPGELSDDEYWDAVTGCDGVRGLLGFLFPLILNDPAGSCAAEAMTDEQLERIGYDALVEASDADTLAAAQAALDLHPECTS